MREIKFRGKIKYLCHKGEWVYGYLTRDYTNQEFRINYFSKEEGGERSHFVEEETIGQFTGFKDIDKRDIYEGDILEDVKDNSKWEVTFTSGCFYFQSVIDDWEAYPMHDEIFRNYSYRVIGNIHEEKK